MSTELWYRLKKAYAFYPGFFRPVCADFLADHYAGRRAARMAVRAAVDALFAAGFFALVPLRALQVRYRYGLDARWQQSAVSIARERFADPNDIALFDVTLAADFVYLLRRFEYAALSKRFNPAGWRDDCVLSDKWLFQQRCQAHGLPVPKLVALRRGRALSVCARPAGDLILKPVGGTGGRGVRVLPVPAGGKTLCGEAALTEWLQTRLPARGDWLVQERLYNHARLRDLAMNALSTTRITTMLDEHGRPEVVAAVQRLPMDPVTCVDNTSGGGLIAGIDAGSGRLLPAMLGRMRGDLGQRFRLHPRSGVPIAGLGLPFWSQSLELVKHAHAAAFVEYTMVGWDVGITAGGPVLVEGNGKPSIVLNQRGTGRPAGRSRMGELIRYHLQRSAAPS